YRIAVSPVRARCSSSPRPMAPPGSTETARTKDPGSTRSFDVLHLLPQPLDLVLQRYDEVGDPRVIRLGSDCVRLPVHLLDEEREPLAHRVLRGRVEKLEKEFVVRSEPDQLLVDVPSFREERDLLSQTAFVEPDSTGQFRHRGGY